MIRDKSEYSGKFNLRLPTELHAELAIRAASSGKSLNQLVTDLLTHSLQAESSIRI